MDDPNPREVIGGNNPPVETPKLLLSLLPELAGSLAWHNAPLEVDLSENLAKARALPAAVTSNDQVAAYGEVAKGLKSVGKRLEAARTDQKAPFRNGAAAVDGYFNPLIEKIDKTITIMGKRTKAWQDAEDDRKRREAAEAARIAREVEEKARAEAKRLQDEADEKRRLEEEQEKARKLAAREAQEPYVAPYVSNAESSALEHFAAQQNQAAGLAAHDARVAEKTVAAKPADNVRVRSSSGAVVTSKKFWTHSIYNLAEIPPATLWPFISDQAKAAAVTAFVKAGNRELPGVRIYEDTKTDFR